MTITIGLRASPNNLVFAVYDSDAGEILNLEEIKIPAALAVPDRLKYMRNNLLDVLREYAVETAGIRETEAVSRSTNISRVQIEGVVQEAFASSNLRSYFVGQIATIAKLVGIERNEFKLLVDGTNQYDIENWREMSSAQREAVLCAIGATNV